MMSFFDSTPGERAAPSDVTGLMFQSWGETSCSREIKTFILLSSVSFLSSLPPEEGAELQRRPRWWSASPSLLWKLIFHILMLSFVSDGALGSLARLWVSVAVWGFPVVTQSSGHGQVGVVALCGRRRWLRANGRFVYVRRVLVDSLICFRALAESDGVE